MSDRVVGDEVEQVVLGAIRCQTVGVTTAVENRS